VNAPGWVLALPAVNAALNAASTVLLVTGFVLIRSGRVRAHMRMMLTSFAVSIAFLACYLTYHFALAHYTGSGSRRFEGAGAVRTVYFAILTSHVILAAVVPVLASMTIYRALRARWPEHKRIARVTFPIWLYVSVTGVIIYGMLYHWPSG
jgi:protein SCO1/2/putative membrane protein